MAEVKFIRPLNISDHFEVPIDETVWNGEYRDSFYGSGKKSGKTPIRDRASFITKSGALIPKTLLANQLKKQCGIYILAFDLPDPAMYIGIAADSKSPEGILSRLQKHRIKATAAHLGKAPTNNGGMNHTPGWRRFAKVRYSHFIREGQRDICSDMRFTYCDISVFPKGDQHKNYVEFVENKIVNTTRIKHGLISLLWPDAKERDVECLNTANNRGLPSVVNVVNFWEGDSFSV